MRPPFGNPFNNPMQQMQNQMQQTRQRGQAAAYLHWKKQQDQKKRAEQMRRQNGTAQADRAYADFSDSFNYGPKPKRWGGRLLLILVFLIGLAIAAVILAQPKPGKPGPGRPPKQSRQVSLR
jgi:hypothetical protein